MSCNNYILFLPRVALPNIFPSLMSWSKLSYLWSCPSHACFLHQIIFSMLLASLAYTNTSRLSPSLSNWFSASSAMSTFQMLLAVFLLDLVNVQVSAAYSAAFQTVLFIICFFCLQFSFRVNNVFSKWACCCRGLRWYRGNWGNLWMSQCHCWEKPTCVLLLEMMSNLVHL